jgi:hypothetical protein
MNLSSPGNSFFLDMPQRDNGFAEAGMGLI